MNLNVLLQLFTTLWRQALARAEESPPSYVQLFKIISLKVDWEVSILAVSRICVSLRYGWDCVMSGRLVIFFYFSIGYYWDITREVAKGTNRVWWPRDLPKNTKSRFALVVPWDLCYIMGFSTCQPPNKYCLLLSTSLNMTEDIIITFYDIMETSPGGSWRNAAIITATISSSIY